MILALVIIWGDYIANSKKARESIFCILLTLLSGIVFFFPDSKVAMSIVLLIAFFSFSFAIIWELYKDILPSRLRAARIAWEMGFTSQNAWKWSKQFEKSRK